MSMQPETCKQRYRNSSNKIKGRKKNRVGNKR